MITTTRFTTSAFLGMASLLPFHGASIARAEALSPEDTPIACIAEQHDFTLQQLRGAGRFVLIHFLPDQPPESQESYVRTCLDGTKSLAGVFNIFVRGDSNESATKLAAPFGKRPAEFAFDSGSKLETEFKIADKTLPTVIALDPDGQELFRETGKTQTELPAFTAIRARLLRAWVQPARGEYNLPKDSTLAVQGYDVVAYFADKKATKGEDRFTADYRGVTYRFASQEHQAAFIASPLKYLPTYGGWCASAIGAKGEKVSIDPTNFKVKDGRLFLFYKGLLSDALKDWNKHEKEWEPAADANWKKIAGE